MYIIEVTNQFETWLRKLKDRTAKAKILVRLKRIEHGNLGDTKSVGNALSEIRITYGPGYRIYYHQKNESILLLLIGGTKSSQSKDIEKAKEILKSLEAENENKN